VTAFDQCLYSSGPGAQLGRCPYCSIHLFVASWSCRAAPAAVIMSRAALATGTMAKSERAMPFWEKTKGVAVRNTSSAKLHGRTSLNKTLKTWPSSLTTHSSGQHCGQYRAACQHKWNLPIQDNLNFSSSRATTKAMT
jgi:hypothetical protein